MRQLLSSFVVVTLAGAWPGCSCNNDVTGDGGGTDDGGASEDLAGIDFFQTDGIPILLGDGGVYICYITPCQGHVYQCGDCVDNDGDGQPDSLDPDCLGPCQNNEAGFYGKIPGQNNAPCKADCYWDQDTGSGNDQCYWDHQCDPYEMNYTPMKTAPEIGCTYSHNTKVGGASVPSGQNDCDYLLANQSTACTNYCKPLTPNGCDCFGCCENPNVPGTYVWAGSANSSGVGTCKSDATTLADQTKCKPCTPVPGCNNPCGRCELCFGKTTLPADCYGTPSDGGVPVGPDGGSPQQCPELVQPCGLPGQANCPQGYYCVTGCCQSVIL